jgi:hypothetical protein
MSHLECHKNNRAKVGINTTKRTVLTAMCEKTSFLQLNVLSTYKSALSDAALQPISRATFAAEQV